MMLLWYIEIDFLCIEGVVVKKNFIIILTLFFLALLSLCGMAHGGGTDENGGHVDKSTGEYHYHHGYPAHQHPDGECPYEHRDFAGVVKPDAPKTTEEDNAEDLVLYSNYIELENLEDVLRSEFEGELADEIRDAIVYNPDTKILDISITYVEYESLWDVSMRQYGEEITERIFCNRDLIVLTPEDIAERHGEEVYEDYDDEDDDSEEEHDDYDDYDYDDREEKPIGKQIIEGICTVIMVALIGWYIIGVIVEIYEDLKK